MMNNKKWISLALFYQGTFVGVDDHDFIYECLFIVNEVFNINHVDIIKSEDTFDNF